MSVCSSSWTPDPKVQMFRLHLNICRGFYINLPHICFVCLYKTIVYSRGKKELNKKVRTGAQILYFMTLVGRRFYKWRHEKLKQRAFTVLFGREFTLETLNISHEFFCFFFPFPSTVLEKIQSELFPCLSPSFIQTLGNTFTE